MRIVGTELVNGAFVDVPQVDVALERPLDFTSLPQEQANEPCEALLTRLTAPGFDGYAVIIALAHRNRLMAQASRSEAQVSPVRLASAQKAGEAAHVAAANYFARPIKP